MKFPVSRCLHSASIKKFDAIVIGSGHNGLTAAAYLQKSGFQVCVLERRSKIGGATVTEEIIPGFKFSRASYVLSLLRPQIYSDLNLREHGLKIYLRNPSSYTPLREKFWKGDARSLTLGSNSLQNRSEISKFSKKDAAVYHKYEQHMERLSTMLEPLFDLSPATLDEFMRSRWFKKPVLLKNKYLRNAMTRLLVQSFDWESLYELLTSPPFNVLRQWFESEPLVATLATDAVIGSMTSPFSDGSGYVLLHHVMGVLEGKRGQWGYPEGGMGAVSQSIASSARSMGATILTNQSVKKILLDASGKACGVLTKNNEEIHGKLILSNATAKITFLDLLPPGTLEESFQTSIENIDYSSPVTKINVAVNRLPDFLADPCRSNGKPEPHHQATIHLNCENTKMVHDAYLDAMAGNISTRPMIEMVIPSVLDKTLAPEGHHVCLLFTQFTPYHLAKGQRWDEQTKEEYANKIFSTIDEYAPGFSNSVIGKEVLSPADLQKIFSLTGGNIFHGAIAPHQLFFRRPARGRHPTNLSPYTPVPHLLLCGSGAHPGGGVTGAPGRLAAMESIKLLKSI